jgi:CheY-like chemotaxis protein
MSASVLIVEDEVLVAIDMEATIREFGFSTVGIAPDSEAALRLAAKKPDIAFVDVNLRDGPTGPEIGAKLSEAGIVVIFVTANPRMLGLGVPGAVGVLNKPIDEEIIGSVLSYAAGLRRGEPAAPPAALARFG